MTPLVDTGPLVAVLDRSDHHHEWAVGVSGATPSNTPRFTKLLDQERRRLVGELHSRARTEMQP